MTSSTCTATTKQGQRCTRAPQGGSNTCWQHRNEPPVQPTISVQSTVPVLPAQPTVTVTVPVPTVQSTIPVQPTVPVPPVQPTVTVPPVQPTVTVPTVQSTIPVQPTVPVPPVQPTAPVPPVQPTASVQPVQPTVSVSPVQPTVPVPPVQPTVPVPPVQPTVTVPTVQPTVTVPTVPVQSTIPISTTPVQTREVVPSETTPLAVDTHARLAVSDPVFANLVRTGTIGDGSCLFHAIGYLADHDRYVALTPTERRLWSMGVRYALSQQITEAEWVQQSREAEIEWLSQLRHTLASMVPKAELETVIAETLATQRTLPELLQSLPERLHKAFPTAFPNEATVRALSTHAMTHGYHAYLASLVRCTTWAGPQEIAFIARVFNLNIFVVSGNGTLVPAEWIGCPAYNRERSSIILFNQGTNHWEPVSRVDADTTTFIFPPDDPVVLHLLSLLGC